MALGLFIGIVAALAIMAFVRRGRRFHRHRRGWGGRAFGRGRLYRIFERLDTTPGQEKAIRTAWLGFAEDARSARDDLMRSRQELAQAIRGPELDEAAITAIFAAHDELLGRLRRSALDGIRGVHEVLDERQRRRLAELLEARFGWGHAGGPYRSRAG